MQSWLTKQTELIVSQFDKSMETHYPETDKFFKDPKEYFRGITTLWNYLDATKFIDYSAYLKPGAKVLDLAGGPGWLSAFLSTKPYIEKIFILDSSKYFLANMVPELTKLMGGNINKVECIEGLFVPLFFNDNSLDAIFVSSSLHHADNLHDTLKEIKRVLKPSGTLFILNETPPSYLRYIYILIKAFAIILKDSLIKKYKKNSPHISSSGYKYDFALGDIYYPQWYWENAILSSGLIFEKKINTKLLTHKKEKNGLYLTHFICSKPSEDKN
ncbi:MAG: hypothetical protein A2204_01205 [Elusimicrobia bacterium RIFOXYA1_FULL_47_7]|nr:MAG: hypothetical protein A2278_01770 [Elusimicrobia bacterium RIFOXYA12_FULL_49_49]OGS10219.1 MAG: hypothetical protein A2204_01205 [Elusimicrobia bacterium RIFOXYA1_FULL_47_7]OGS11665.1 MAG: hypothetical protein A2386_03310 [Elusimicrobia bacterium RIFOXYB1_FULL_48_9]OGS16777.1 MAG: hypothetical protein A2251_05220 [Elusimicrobia bacterium RIFOXYA2_FULL_47_53]OGS32005.1 MAG: hypothetical protein A2323_07995 [Elusimicrobia bacterium RIFOXYB2_FULL_46_23]